MLTLHRVPSYADRLRAYKVVIDGAVVGKIKYGETITLPPPTEGPHEIWITVDWCRCNKLPFHYANTPLNFEVVSSMKGLRVFLAIAYLFMPTEWAVVRQVN